MTELKKKLSTFLTSSINKLFSYVNDVNKVPLSIDVDVTLQSLVQEDVNQDNASTLDSLKVSFICLFFTLLLLLQIFNSFLIFCFRNCSIASFFYNLNF